MDRGAWWARVHGVTKSWTRLSDQAQGQDVFGSCLEHVWKGNRAGVRPKEVRRLWQVRLLVERQPRWRKEVNCET